MSLHSRLEVASFFGASIEGAIGAIESCVRMLKAKHTVSSQPRRLGHYQTTSRLLSLVGGFGGSPWLFQRLRSRLAGLGLSLSRPNVPTCVPRWYFPSLMLSSQLLHLVTRWGCLEVEVILEAPRFLSC